MIENYLNYLKDISRKIVGNSGFEKALLDKSRKDLSFAFQKEDNSLSFVREDELFQRIKRIEGYLSTNNDKKLFCGFGLIAGNKGRQYAAPIIYVECSIIKENGEYVIEPDFGTSSFNYDLITSILNYNFVSRYNLNDDDENFNENLQNEIEIVEEIENGISKLDNLESIEKYALRIFQLLEDKLNGFKEIPQNDNLKDYSFTEEIGLFKAKPTKKDPIERRARKSIFEEEELTFINKTHFFVNNIPHQLSTYEALKQLIDEVENNKFQNNVLNNLLTNILTNKTVELIENEIEDVEEILKKYIPLPFSDSQIASIKNAFNSQVSYIQGPPGTGKSYTIGGIVLCSLFLNKKVLLVSQKEPALDVIKEKIEGCFTDLQDNDAFRSITYYRNTNKPALRNDISNLKSYGDNQTNLNNLLGELSLVIEEDLEWIQQQISRIDVQEIKLRKNLQKEHSFQVEHNSFVRDRNWFINQPTSKEIKLDKNYSFESINTKISSYEIPLSTITKIIECPPTLATELYKHKFKAHLKEKFKIQAYKIADLSLPQYSKDLIELHEKHSNVIRTKSTILFDNEQIRSNIEHLKNELTKRQKLFLKRKFRYITLSKLSKKIDFQRASSALSNLDKLDKLLYWSKTSRIADQMSKINYNSILDTMPFWLAEVRYLGQVLPMKAEMFDIVIVDEASQVNLAEILPAFYRGKQIVIVGDHEQLGLDSSGVNFRLSNRFDSLVWTKNFNDEGISFASATDKKLTVTQCSILDLVRSSDNNVSIRTEMLKEHFRSMPSLAKFTNSNFYDSLLRIMTETPEKINESCFKVIQVNGQREKNKTIVPEAEKIINLIKNLIGEEVEKTLFDGEDEEELNIPNLGSEFTIGVISLMTNQRELISDLIEENIPLDKIDKYKIEVWTPQSAQGNERDIIFLSLCLDMNSSGRGNYHKNPRLLNVATSRAKKFTVAVHSGFQTDKYPQLGQYLNLTANKMVWTMDHSAYDSEFEKKVYEYLKKYIDSKQDEADLRIYNQVETCGQKRLDFVVFNETNKKSVAIEVDGSYHYNHNGLANQYSSEHIERIDILKRAGWNIINTPYYKWYRNGWLSNTDHPVFKKELDRIIGELDYYLF